MYCCFYMQVVVVFVKLRHLVAVGAGRGSELKSPGTEVYEMCIVHPETLGRRCLRDIVVGTYIARGGWVLIVW